MAESMVMQVRIDKKLKNDVENLYNDLGLTFAMAIKLFAKQSLIEQGLPFTVTKKHKAGGSLSKYANPELRKLEDKAWKLMIKEKYEKHNWY